MWRQSCIRLTLISLSPGKCESSIKRVIYEHMLWIQFMSFSFELDLKWMQLSTFDIESTLALPTGKMSLPESMWTQMSGDIGHIPISWWRHQMETFSALLALCAGNSPVPVNSPHKGQWRGSLMFSLICAWINGWVNNREAGDLRRNHAHYDVNVMLNVFLAPLAPTQE